MRLGRELNSGCPRRGAASAFLGNGTLYGFKERGCSLDKSSGCMIFPANLSSPDYPNNHHSCQDRCNHQIELSAPQPPHLDQGTQQ